MSEEDKKQKEKKAYWKGPFAGENTAFRTKHRAFDTPCTLFREKKKQEEQPPKEEKTT